MAADGSGRAWGLALTIGFGFGAILALGLAGVLVLTLFAGTAAYAPARHAEAPTAAMEESELQLGYVEGGNAKMAPKPAPSPAAAGFGARRGPGRGDVDEAERSVAKQEAPPEEVAAERPRAWFPEAFLWQPLVETGDDGLASVDLTVPDSLTSWRVLGLAHDRAGQQTGAVLTFDSTLPVYVDPVVPGWLHAGDRVVLPVQVVNTTSDALSGTLTLDASGAVSGSAAADLDLGPAGSDVASLAFDVRGAGEAVFDARFAAGDRVDRARRTVPVAPLGRPVERTAGGTLTDRRPLDLPATAGADPLTESLEVTVFGGPLAVLDAELDRLAAGARGGSPAYGFALASRHADLAAALGRAPDPDRVRKVRLLEWQRVARAARAPDPGAAADLLVGLHGELGVEPADPVRKALVRAVLDAQRADGTWARRPTSTLQELLVVTAATARALPDDARPARLRAAAALERHLPEVKDPFTAAVLLASGLLDGDAAELLTTTLRDAVKVEADGAARVALTDPVTDAWGLPPASREVSAWAVLALPPDDPLRRDLAASLLLGWSADAGFGAGPADALALEAVASALPAEPAKHTVSLVGADGSLASGILDPGDPGKPLRLTAQPGPGGFRDLALVADPPLAGVAFTVIRRAYVPWSDADRLPGVDLEWATACPATGDPCPLTVGAPGSLDIAVAAPAGTTVRLEQPLPPGATPDRDEVLAANPALGPARVQVLLDRVILETEPFAPGVPQTLHVPFTPAFAGEFSTGPVLLTAGRRPPVPVAPYRFVVRESP